MSIKKIVIAGGGIGGLTLLSLTRKLEIDCTLFEKAKEFEAKGSGLSIMSNALLALKEFDLDGALLEIGQPINLFEVRDQKNRTIFTSDFNKLAEKVGMPSICLHRADLQSALTQLAKSSNNIVMDAKISDFQVEQNNRLISQFLIHRESEVLQVESDFLIGCDGSKSKVRELLENKYPNQIPFKTPFRASGFKVFLATIPFHSENFKKGDVLHFWGHGIRVGLIDIGQKRLYYWITINNSILPEGLEKSPTKVKKDILLRFLNNFPMLVKETLLQTPDDTEIIEVETLDRKPRAFWGSGRVTLLGDAAHPTLTSLGQGAGMAIEDAVQLIKNLSADFSQKGLRHYEGVRFKRSKKYVDLARSVATYEQFQNPLAVYIRNQFFRALPTTLLDKQNISLLQFPSNIKKRINFNRNNYIFVTGASSGLGENITTHLLEKGYSLIATVRDKSRLPLWFQSLPKDLSKHVHLIEMDLNKTETIINACNEVKELVLTNTDYRLKAVINNAGICIAGPLELISEQDLLEQMRVNWLGPIIIIKELLPLLRQNHSMLGQIINVGSAAGKIAFPFLGPYASSKFALEALSDSLRREVKDQKISVTHLQVGSIYTPIWDKLSQYAKLQLENSSGISSFYGEKMNSFLELNQEEAKKRTTQAIHVSKEIYKILNQKAPSIRVQIGSDAKLNSLLLKFIPDFIVDYFIEYLIQIEIKRKRK